MGDGIRLKFGAIDEAIVRAKQRLRQTQHQKEQRAREYEREQTIAKERYESQMRELDRRAEVYREELAEALQAYERLADAAAEVGIDTTAPEERDGDEAGVRAWESALGPQGRDNNRKAARGPQPKTIEASKRGRGRPPKVERAGQPGMPPVVEDPDPIEAEPELTGRDE